MNFASVQVRPAHNNNHAANPINASDDDDQTYPHEKALETCVFGGGILGQKVKNVSEFALLELLPIFCREPEWRAKKI